MLVSRKNYKVSIISLPKFNMHFSAVEKFLTRLLGRYYSHDTIVQLSSDFARGKLTLSSNYRDFLVLLIVSNTTE